MNLYVTVGTNDFPFLRLFRFLDEVDHVTNDIEVFAQFGETAKNNVPYKGSDYLTYSEHCEKIDWSDLVVGHAGIGTVLTVLERGKPILVVPRESRFNEHVDDHQIEFAERVEGLEQLKVASNKECFVDAIKTFRSSSTTFNFGDINYGQNLALNIQDEIFDGQSR